METSRYTGMQVVLIDDDVLVLKSLQLTLEDMGFDIKAFSDPLKALEWIEQNGADIVISDICMPNCDGFRVLKRVKEIDPQCDLIFITAHGQMDIAIRALREGATDFFEKPLTAAILQAAMERTSRFRQLSLQKQLLTDRATLLSQDLDRRSGNKVMIGKSPAMQRLAQSIVDVAASDATVLILGESGTGKELVARAIHDNSRRRNNAFLTVNCPSIPEDLFESEMFGHRKGSFTGAMETRSGYVVAADGGTIFLDEIGDMPLKSQPKILRLLEEKSFLPIGEHKEKTADVRIITATNQELEKLMADRRFRDDLYYRLKVCTIQTPALRERKEDIPLLALYFILVFSSELRKPVDGIEDDAMAYLMAYDYPGNVRELRNMMESTIIHCKHSGKIARDDLQNIQNPTAAPAASAAGTAPASGAQKLADMERQLYQETLAKTGNNISAASRSLGLSRGKLRRRLESLNIAYLAPEEQPPSS